MIDAFSEFISSKVKLQKSVDDTTKGIELQTKNVDTENKETVLGTTSEAQDTLNKIANGEITSDPEVDHTGETVVAQTETTTSADDKPSSNPIDESKQTREDTSTNDQNQPSEEPKGSEQPNEVTLDSVENFIGNLDLDTVDADTLEKLLALADMINIAVEAKVKESISQTLQATA